MRLTSSALSERPDACVAGRVVALHGDNEGRVRATARLVVEAALGGVADPFRLTILAVCDSLTLTDALRTRSLTGDRPVIWVQEATERLAEVIESALADASDESPLLVLSFGSRFASTALARQLGESDRAWLVDCAADEGAMARAAERVLMSIGVSASPLVLASLVSRARAGGQEVEAVATALALLAGPGASLTEGILSEFAGEDGEAALGAALAAALGGQPVPLDRLLQRGLAEGSGGVALIRQALGAARYARGLDRDQAGSALWAAERLAKSTGFPADLVAAAAVAALGRDGRQGPR